MMVSLCIAWAYDGSLPRIVEREHAYLDCFNVLLLNYICALASYGVGLFFLPEHLFAQTSFFFFFFHILCTMLDERILLFRIFFTAYMDEISLF
jgi:hypothetical protein